MESINIAVIGANGVGKSAFIQRALRLPRAPTTSLTRIRQDLDGTPYAVTLVELDLEVFDVDPEQPIQWPKQIGGHMVTHMDGALILYDVMNKESIRDLPPTMGEDEPRCHRPHLAH
jgi:GTPase SAR1 family protein